MFVTFGAYVRYGKLDSVDYDVEVELTEEEYERVKESSKTHWRMRDDDSISDIYDRVYEAALDIDLEVMRDTPELLAEKMAWYLDISEEEALERFFEDEEIIEMLENEGDRGISYPSNLEDERDFEEEE